MGVIEQRGKCEVYQADGYDPGGGESCWKAPGAVWVTVMRTPAQGRGVCVCETVYKSSININIETHSKCLVPHRKESEQNVKLLGLAARKGCVIVPCP